MHTNYSIIFVILIAATLSSYAQNANNTQKAEFDPSVHSDYINSLQEFELPEDYAAQKERRHLFESTVLPNPAGNYSHKMGVRFNYTFYRDVNLTAGQVVTFETKNSNADPVMYLFFKSNPNQGSWMNDDGGTGLNSKISVRIPRTGTYCVLLRSYSSSSPGVGDLYKNGSLYQSRAAIAGALEPCASKTGDLNYFTCKASGDTRLWLVASNGTIRAHNDDYRGPGDFGWGLTSRVKGSFTGTPITHCLVSAYSSNSQGSCDLYMGCKNSTVMSYFPNLKAGDAIQSAPQSRTYNCASWAGGITGNWSWVEANSSSPWYVSGNPQASWNKFFGNNPARYSGAINYTKSGANASNGEVAMWRKSNGENTHFSVRKPANNHPHGYDWESKPGGLMRTFHPKNALNGSSYGQIYAYYKRTGSSARTYTLKESVDLGLTVLQDVALNEKEMDLLNALKAKTPVEVSTKFNEKLALLYKKANSPEMMMHSNPHFLYETKEYKDIIEYCTAQGKTVWPLLFENIFFNKKDDLEYISVSLINQVTSDFGYLMEEVKKEWSDNNYTKEGAYIAPSAIANTKNYVRKLLAFKTHLEPTSTDDKVKVDNHELVSVFPNPFKYQTNITFNVMEDNSTVTLEVFDMNGTLIETVFANTVYSAGSHQLTWAAKNHKSGLYFFNITINGESVNRRFLIE